MTKSIKLSNEQAKELYKNAPDFLKTLLVNAFGKKTLNADLMTWVKSWDDIESLVGDRIEIPYDRPASKQEKSINALFKLQIIIGIFNEGWTPDFTSTTEQKWYPWFIKDARSELLFHDSFYHCHPAALGFGLYCKSKAISNYVANTFTALYLDYLPE